ncbi:CAP domain-containing protein [Histomonas meleagridis]|uniref:CAP domain-containing protein n=1 Tax=Histomonas meleagridis TaxID=135588 RepID=UPI003559B793|nr:CAP domain-containing protein [Histomonas meleagridis]KAH0799438.1 CAP domain-containing protein [Histomonas meleagridis]
MLCIFLQACFSATVTWPELENRTPQEVCSKYNTLHVYTHGYKCHVASSDECGVGYQTDADKSDALNVMNFYRYACGLNDLVQSQDAAVIQSEMEACKIMEANGIFSHDLTDQSLTCWTQAGSTGASSSNIYWSSGTACGSNSIASYMDDRGVSSCGHRRWLLLPTLSELAQGVNGHYSATRVFGFNRVGTSSPIFIAYPPPGAFPVNLIPDVWTFSRQWNPSGGSLHSMPSDTQVSVTYDGTAISLSDVSTDTQNSAMYSGVVFFTPASKPTNGQKVQVVITSMSADTEWRYSFQAVDCSTITQTSTRTATSTATSTSTRTATGTVATPTPTPEPTPEPVTDHLDIYYVKSTQGREDNETQIYLTTFSELNTQEIPSTIKSITVHLSRSMTSTNYLSLENLRNQIDLTYISTSSRYNCYVDAHLLTRSVINKLTFDKVNVNLVNSDFTSTTLLNIKSLSFINDATVADYNQFEKISFYNLEEVEYSNYDMALSFEKISQNSQIGFSEDLSEFIISDNISFKSTSHRTEETISSNYQEINIKTSTSFTLTIDENTTSNTKVNFEFTKANRKITIPSKEFKDDFSFGLILNENGAEIELEDSNILPVEVKGKGELNIVTPNSYNKLQFTKSITVESGNIEINVLSSINTIQVSIVNMNGESKISTRSITSRNGLLLANNNPMIEIDHLLIERDSTSTISNSIINSMEMLYNSYLVFEDSLNLTSNIVINYGNMNYQQSIITLNVSDLTYKANIMLRKYGDDYPEHFNVISGDSQIYTADICGSTIINEEDDRYEFKLEENNGITTLSADLKADNTVVIVVVVVVVVIVVIAALVVVLVILRRNKHRKSSSS